MPTDQLILQPDATQGVDTYLSDAAPTTNFGTADPINVRFNTNPVFGINRVLLRFDLSTLPGGATITAAKLTVNTTTAVSGAAEVDRITQPAWTEAGATWLTYDGTNLWAAAGGDFTTTDQVTFTSPAATGSFDITGLATLCTDAVVSRANLLDLLLKFTTEATTNKFFAFSSSDNGTAGNRPKLTIDYTTPDVQRRLLKGVGK